MQQPTNQSPQPDLRKQLLTLMVRTPERVIYQGKAVAVSSVNEKGIFDVLPAHQNFITLIRDRLIIYDELKQKQEISVQSGVVRVVDNQVSAYLGIETIDSTKQF